MVPRLQSLKDSLQKLNSKTDSVVEQEEILSPSDLNTRKSPRLVGKENNIAGAYTPGSLLRKSIGGKKKRVSFGDILSPEYFDKRLPPMEPVRLGASPAGTPASKDRRRSDPLRSKALISSAKKRVSLGIGLSSIAIEEEDEPQQQDSVQTLLKFDDSPVKDPFEDSPNTKSKLPPPIMAEPVQEAKKSSTPQSASSSKSKRRSSLQGKPVLRVRRSSTSTPTRKLSIGTPKKLKAPIRKEIEERKSSTPAANRLPTPVRDEIHSGPNLRSVYKKLPTALQEDIGKGKKLQATKKKILKTPLRKDIQSKPLLRRTLKKGLKTPIRQEIRKGKPFSLMFSCLCLFKRSKTK